MTFCIECNALTDDNGRAVPFGDTSRTTYNFVDAATAADAILSLVGDVGVEVMGRLHRVGSIQALATVRRGRSAMTLHAYPEEETEWRTRKVR